MTIEMTVSQARSRLGDVLDTARMRRQPVFLTRHGKRVGVIQGIEQWDRIAEVAPTRAEVQQQIDAIVQLANGLIDPDIPPLLDATAFYETREPHV
ncbi:MAG: type II toxin-antitoxin system Phd/YefM family antitoxin [Propionibacteriaceae bacterium]|nr:type II toxin-antitoxin system Phd/YefM family antitoxin [Propionibacteriaceae bacterium]